MGSTTDIAVLDRVSAYAINLNDTVEVDLTDRGFEVLKKNFWPSVSAEEALGAIEAHRVQGMTFRFQLYELMRVFGSDIPGVPSMNYRAPFTACRIVLAADPIAIQLAAHQARP